MSSGLHTLIRLHKWRLDEKRRALAELQALADKLAQDTARLEREITAEQEIARTSPEAAFGYGNFAKQAIERRRRLAQSVAQVEQQIARSDRGNGRSLPGAETVRTGAGRPRPPGRGQAQGARKRGAG